MTQKTKYEDPNIRIEIIKYLVNRRADKFMRIPEMDQIVILEAQYIETIRNSKFTGQYD